MMTSENTEIPEHVPEELVALFSIKNGGVHRRKSVGKNDS